jgi:hypothetical protein
MAAPGIPLTAINGGMNRLRVKGAARRDTLYLLQDGYVTAANTIKKRPGSIRNVDLSVLGGSGNSKGLVAFNNALHVFSAQQVAVPAGYVDHVLTHPAGTAQFTPPFPAVAWANTVPNLLHFEDGNGSTTFADSGANPVTWTSVGGAACSTGQAKFGSGSLSVNGNTKYIKTTIQPGDAIDLITGQPDWTIECWVYYTSFPASDLINVWDFTNGGNEFFRCYLQSTGGGLPQQFGVQCFGAGPWASAGVVMTIPALALNTWHHVAVCRDGLTLRAYINGSGVVGSVGNVPNNFVGDTIRPAYPANSVLRIGAASFGVPTTIPFFIDEFRITKGSCLYGGNFSQPTAVLTATANQLAPYSVISLQHFDDGSGSTAFTDSAGGTTWTPHGAAQEVITPAKFGGSGAFLLDADYLSTTVAAAAFNDLTYDAGDFTVEGFIYPLDVTPGTNHYWWDLAHKTNATSDDTLFYVKNNGQTITVRNPMNGASGDITANGALPTAATWYHIAVVRYGPTLTLFVNGVNVGSSTFGNAQFITGTGAQQYISSRAGGAATTCDGYQDEFRILKGLALYRANFVPPAAPYTAPGLTPITLKEIHFAAPFVGFLYVVAEFTSDGGTGLGTVFHYWLQTSGTWKANTAYQVGQIVSPVTPNGLNYKATRLGAPNPVWAPSTLKAVSSVVEPTVPNGFKFTATAVDGLNPLTGTTEPTWPTTDGTVVIEETERTNAGTVTTAAPQPAPTVPSPGITPRYANIFSNKTAKP